MSIHTSIRGFHALLAALFLTVVLVVACSPDPTATPVPTNTPVPTPTPTATPTPEPTPTPTPEPTPTPAPSTDMMPGLMMDMTGGDLMAMMSAEEIECVQAAVGDEGLAAMETMSVFLLSDSMAMVADCFSPALTAMLSIAFLSAQVGGLTDESTACLTDFYAEYGATPPDGSDPAEEIVYTFTFLLCLTDEEAEALTLEGDDAPAPSELRCLTAQTDQETLTLLLTSFMDLFSGNASPEVLVAMQEVQAAAEVCGVDLLTLG